MADARSQAPSSDTPSHKLKVEVGALCVGMYVCELDRPWIGSPFQFQGFPLRSVDEIQQIREFCEYVYVDRERSARSAIAELMQAQQRTVSSQRKLPKPRNRLRDRLARLRGRFWHKRATPLAQRIDHDLARSEATFDESRKLVRDIMEDVRLGRSIDTPKAKEAVAECVDHILSNPDAVLMLSNIKNKDAYTSEHSLNVAILSIILGRKLGMARHQLEEIGLAGMLHDVGKVLTPTEILNKPERLTDEEFLIMKMHPSQGRDILSEQEGLNRTALNAAHGHHERLNGTGYPRGLADTDIDFITRIVAVTDTFDAITSDRVYGPGRTNIEAFKILQAASGNRYDAKLVSHFLDAIGVYPPGSAVQLRNGEFAVVVRNNPQYKLRPVVLVLKNAEQRPIRPRYLDLAEAKSHMQIARMVSAEQYGLDVHVFRSRGFRESLRH
jgi:HD-GYP domain-containing protein (c-di-GMP phosphodiesterase class II)